MEYRVRIGMFSWNNRYIMEKLHEVTCRNFEYMNPLKAVPFRGGGITAFVDTLDWTGRDFLHQGGPGLQRLTEHCLVFAIHKDPYVFSFLIEWKLSLCRYQYQYILKDKVSPIYKKKMQKKNKNKCTVHHDTNYLISTFPNVEIMVKSNFVNVSFKCKRQGSFFLIWPEIKWSLFYFYFNRNAQDSQISKCASHSALCLYSFLIYCWITWLWSVWFLEYLL